MTSHLPLDVLYYLRLHLSASNREPNQQRLKQKEVCLRKRGPGSRSLGLVWQLYDAFCGKGCLGVFRIENDIYEEQMGWRPGSGEAGSVSFTAGGKDLGNHGVWPL